MGCLAEVDLGIFANMMKREVGSGDSLSIEGGRRKCSGMRDSMASDISKITNILPELARYS